MVHALHLVRGGSSICIAIACTALAGCGMFSGGSSHGDDLDDSKDMTEMPRRGEMPSLTGPESHRVNAARLPVIGFAEGQWMLDKKSDSTVIAVTQWLRSNPVRVVLAGTAKADSPEYARQLGELRCQTVKQQFIASGIPAERIATVSFGSDAADQPDDAVRIGIVATGAEPAEAAALLRKN